MCIDGRMLLKEVNNSGNGGGGLYSMLIFARTLFRFLRKRGKDF